MVGVGETAGLIVGSGDIVGAGEVGGIGGMGVMVGMGVGPGGGTWAVPGAIVPMAVRPTASTRPANHLFITPASYPGSLRVTRAGGR